MKMLVNLINKVHFDIKRPTLKTEFTYKNKCFLISKINTFKDRFSTRVGKRLELFTIFAIHRAYDHLFLFC